MHCSHASPYEVQVWILGTIWPIRYSHGSFSVRYRNRMRIPDDIVSLTRTFKLFLYTYATLSIFSILFIQWNSEGGNCFCFSTIFRRNSGNRFACMNHSLISSRRRFSRTNSCALAQGKYLAVELRHKRLFRIRYKGQCIVHMCLRRRSRLGFSVGGPGWDSWDDMANRTFPWFI